MSAKASLKERILAVALAVVLIASFLPVGAIRASAESSGQLTTDIGTKTFRVGVATEFTFSTVANDDAGTMVKGSFVFSDPSALEKLEYLESKDGNWYEFYGDFGPATGFPLIDGTSRFRATFSKAGTYSVTAQMVRVENGTTVCSTSAQVKVPWVSGQLTTNISEKSFKLGEATEFTFTTTANDDAGTMVKGSFTFSDPSAIEKLEYLESRDGNWYEFYGDFGPVTGFPLIDGTSTFRATFNKAGSYTVTAQIKRIADESVLCETTANVTATWTAAELSTDISEKAFIYGKTTEFTYTTTANDDVGAMVKGTFSVSDPSAIEKLEYLETQDGNWYEFSGDFGPASGFPLSDATSRFRVTFNKVGDFSATVRIVSANSDQVYCEKTTPFTVGKADIEGVSVSGKNYDYNGSKFELVEITGLADGDTVTYQVNDGPETNEMPKESAVGSYTVKVVVTRNDNYNPFVQTVESNIDLGKIDLGDLTIHGLRCEYDGNPHNAVNVTGQGEYTLEYKLGEDGTWSTTIPQVTDAGSYLVTVKAVKDENYKPIDPVDVIPADGAEYPFNVYISKAPQTVEFAEADPVSKTWSPIAANNTYTNELLGGNAAEAVGYSAEISNMTYSGQPCAEIDAVSGKVTFYGAGTVTVTATKPGDNNYKDASATYTLTILRADQNEFHFAQEVPTNVRYNDNGNQIELSTTGGNGGGIVTYEITDEPENCVTLSENILTIVTAGNVTVTATKAETDTYNAISDTLEIVIEKAEQTIAFEDTTTATVNYGTTFVNAAHEVEDSGAADGNGYADTAITYEVVAGQALASVTPNGELQITNGAFGTVTVKATKAGNDCYLETSAEYTVEIVAAQTPDAPYTITGDRVEGNESGWYVGNVTITPKEGYLISESNALTDNTWYEKIIVTDEGSNEKTVYLKNDDGITDAILIPAIEIRIDKTAPDQVSIQFSTSVLDTILSVGTFGFYDAPATVTVSAHDETSHVQAFEITYGDTTETIDAEDTRFQYSNEDKDASASLEIPAEFRGKVSVVAIDTAGLRTDEQEDKTVVVDEVAPCVDVSFDNENVSNNIYYNAPRTATITITEDNFFPESMEKEQKTLTDPFAQGDAYLVITVVRVDDDRNSTTKVYKSGDLSFTETSEGSGVLVGEIPFTEDGDYTFTIDYKDFSDNYDAATSHYETSFTIDQTAPQLSFAPATADYETNDFTATLTVIEHNFRASDMEIEITAKDANNDDVTLTRDYEAYLKDASNWTQNGNTYTIPLPFDVDARYDLTITYSDLAGNPQEEEVHEVFVLDKVAPTNLTISYSESVLDTILGVASFGFYNAPATVTITADDETAGIEYLEYYFIGEDGQELANTRTRVDLPDEGSKTASVEFKVEAKFRAKIGFDAVDRAGWKTVLLPDKDAIDAAEIVVVDEVAPGVEVTYNNNSAQNSTYYNAPRTATITITEDNFFPESMEKEQKTLTDPFAQGDAYLMITVVRVDDDGNSSTKVYKSGDLSFTETSEGSGIWTETIDFVEDGDYTFSIDYKDFSDNYDAVKSHYETSFTIDNIDPTIDVKHSNNDAQNGTFFKADRPVEIKITEHNFRAEDVVVKVTADRATGTVTDYAAYLTNPANWSTNGNTHTANIVFDTEAYYTFEISYKDMAGRENATVNFGESVAPTAFTIDKSAPTGGDITISGVSVLASSDGLAFDTFYRNAVSVVFSANFDISGQDNIKYQKVTTLSEAPSDSGWISYTGSVAAEPNERFVVYFRAEDNAGNVSVFHSTGIVVDDKAPVGERYAPQIDIVPAAPNENGIHSANVPVSLKVIDPKYSEQGEDNVNGYYSGLNKVTYRIYTQDTGAEVSGTLLDLTPDNRKTDGAVFDDNGLISSWSGSITVAASTFNSNNVIVEVTAVDNAGNERITTNTDVGQPIRIDITLPAISVSYDNNNGDTAFASANTDAYFNADRTATITVTERNFDPAKVVITLTNSNGTTPVLSGWRTEQGSGNGDNTRHIATLNYVADGDYNFNISCTDQAGLANTAVTYNGLAPQKFTIDKTAPVITVTYDNNEAQNGNYYKASRTATITINEHNFETSRITVTLTATDHGSAILVPTINGWTDNGDSHTATILYDADALYGFDIEYRDKAGNAAADYAGDSFYVDQTAPHVEITGIADESANNDKGNIGFVLSATDTNFDVFTPVVTAVLVEDGNIITKVLEVGEIENIDDGKQLVVTNLPDDGIYRISCTVIDKAGNAFEEVTLFDKDGNEYVEARSGADSLVTFSVNRDGSTYEVDEYTSALSEKYYVQRVTDDVAIIEINADNLTSYSITLNGRELQEGTDYEVSLEGGNGDWFKYTYRINASLFDAEGEYNLVVSSVDKAENDAFSDVKGASIHFVVDRTAPLVAISGLASNARYQTEKQTVTLIPTDDGGALKSILVLLVDDEGKAIRTLVDLQGEDFENALAENDGKITFELEEGLYQNVRIICDDYADFGSEENVIYDETFTNVSVSSSAFMIFWANKPLRWGVIGGTGGIGIGAALLALLKKRKKVTVG